MALLQISEPGMAPDPHQRRLAIGIDLGTTHSLVATVRSGVPEVLPDLQGETLLPSVVRLLPDGTAIVGAQAAAAAVDDPENVIVSAKRLMGRGRADLPAGLPYRFADGEGMVTLRTVAGARSPVEISAEILRVLRRRAEEALGCIRHVEQGEGAEADVYDQRIEGAVVTVPAYFDDAQRQATKDAAKLAGLNVLRLLNEPTAAAIAYGLDNAAEGVYVVYDLGGGTFDVSVLRMTRGVFEVIATGGDSALGGDDFDRALVGAMLARAGVDGEALSPGARRALQVAARDAKERLSDADVVTVSVLLDGQALELPVTRAELDAACEPLVARTLRALRAALRDAALSVDEVQGVVLVGGATRMPAVRAAVRDVFGREPLADIDPDRVVALGAAMQADQLVGNRSEGGDWLLLDVIPLSLGLETMGGLVEKIVPRNSTIPVQRAQEFTTFKDGQTALAVHVVQGERELVADCRSLARFELRGIPPMAAGAARIRVSFQVDADGLLSVSARELGTGIEASVQVKPSYGLSDDEVARMLQESFGTATEDMRLRALREQQVEADRMIVATRNAMAADGDLLEAGEREGIEEQVRCLHRLAHGEDHLAIKEAIEQLAHRTEDFAARRMNRAIQTALSGRSIDQIND